MTTPWLDTAEAARWIRLAWERSYPTRVSDLVPPQFEAYARVFHPLDLDGETVRWAEAARRQGVPPHAELRLIDVVAVPQDDPTRVLRGQAIGVLPEAEFRALCRQLRPHTASPTVFVGFWEGFAHVEDGSRLALAQRRYALAELDIDDLDQARGLVPGFSPNLVWPADRCWFVNTDIDAASTYIGGPAAAVADVLGCADLEALLTTPTHRVPST